MLRIAKALTPVIWVLSGLIICIGLSTTPSHAEHVETYWSAYPFHLMYRSIQVRDSLTFAWPYGGSESLWQVALTSAVEEMDTETTLSVTRGSGPTTNTVIVTYGSLAGVGFDAASIAITTWASIHPFAGTIDCIKNHYALNAASLPQCDSENNLVNYAQVNVSTTHPALQPSAYYGGDVRLG